MSANRIIKRRAFAEVRPNGHAHWAAHRRGEAAATRPTYHDYAIDAGSRHPSFQRAIRRARAEEGLTSTSTDMCRVHGRRVS